MSLTPVIQILQVKALEQHSAIAASSGALFSPGYKLDGTDF